MTRVFEAPRERVFEVLTKPEHIGKWWGPKGASFPTVELDARAGGQLFLAERAPNGAMNYQAGIVREITPPSRVVFATHFVDEKRRRVGLDWAGVPVDWKGDIIQEVTLAAEGAHTVVTIRITGFPSPQWGEMAQYGLAESFDRLGYAVTNDMRVASAGQAPSSS